MSGSAGLSPSRNRKPEGSTLSVYARNLKKECAGLVAGQAVLTAEIKTRTCIRHRPLPTPTERLLSFNTEEQSVCSPGRCVSFPTSLLRGCAQGGRVSSGKSFLFNLSFETKGLNGSIW